MNTSEEISIMKQDSMITLLQASTILSGVVVSCVDKKNYPFTKTQMNIFTILDMEGDLSMKRIAQFLATSQEQATRTVAPLANAGYVERRTDPSNRTRVYIHLTESGRKIMEDSRKVLLENMSEKFSTSLNNEDCVELCKAAATMVDLLNKIS